MTEFKFADFIATPDEEIKILRDREKIHIENFEGMMAERDKWEQLATRYRARFAVARLRLEHDYGGLSDDYFDVRAHLEGHDKAAAEELNAEAKRLIVVEDGDITVLSDAIQYLDDHQHVIRCDAENYNKIWEAIHMLERWKKQLEASQ